MKTAQKSEWLTTTLQCAMKTSLMQQKLCRCDCDGDCVDLVVWVACSSSSNRRSHCCFSFFLSRHPIWICHRDGRSNRAPSLSIRPNRLFANLFLSILVCVCGSQLNLHVLHVYATMFMHAIQFQLLISFVCLREIDKTQQYAINLEMHRSHTGARQK